MNRIIRLAGTMVLGIALAGSASASEPTRKVAEPATPQRGIEPDEIDARATARQRTPARVAPARAGGTVPTPGKFVVAKDDQGEPQRYEVADCSTPDKNITCCTKGDGPGASCNLFILLCNETGGTGKGDGGDAICVK